MKKVNCQDIAPKTVGELVELLKKCPQDYPIHNADSEKFCILAVVSSDSNKENNVLLY